MKPVPFLDLQAAHAELASDLQTAIHACLNSGNYIGGAEVESFEVEFAEFTGARFCMGVANGLDALVLALTAMEVGPGDEVIVPSHTFIATWLAVSRVGAVPVPVEPDPQTMNIDPGRIESALSDRTRAIIPVHLYGQPVHIGPILEIARRHGLLVLEDAAQCQGARLAGQRVGNHGDAVAWSFYPGKNLGAFGDAGAITTSNQAIADRVRMLRNYGSRVKYVHELSGFNSRLDPVQAAVLRVKLRALDEWNARRRGIASRYIAELAGAPVELPAVMREAEPVWHLFVVRSKNRDRLATHLASQGVSTIIHYPIPPHLQGAYLNQGLERGSLPVAESLAESVLSLPIGPHLGDQDVSRVISAVLSFPA